MDIEQTLQAMVNSGASRIQIAASFGYFDARAAVMLYQTHGLHFSDMLPILKRHNLKMDWSGVESELQLQCGMSDESSRSVVEEAKRFELFLKPRVLTTEAK